MKPHPEDPRLTSFLLGELAPEDRAEVEYAIATDPAVRLAVEELERMQVYLHDVLGGGKEELLPRQRENIKRAAREASRKGKIVQLGSHRQTRKFWVPLAAAAVIGAGIFLLTMIPAPKGERGVRQVATASESPVTPENSRSLDRGEGHESTPSPLRVEKRSLPQIAQAVRTEGRLPEPEEVKITEMLNAFPLQARDAVAVSKGCTLGADVLPCPWKPSGTLVLISLQGARDSERQLEVRFIADEESMSRHKLLGAPVADGADGVVVRSRMTAGGRSFLVLEVAARSSSLGRLVWEVDGEEAPAIQLVRDPSKEPSNDARFAALVAGFGLWLRGEDAPMVDDSMVLGLAREVAAESMVPDRDDFLNLVDQAVRLGR